MRKHLSGPLRQFCPHDLFALSEGPVRYRTSGLVHLFALRCLPAVRLSIGGKLIGAVGSHLWRRVGSLLRNSSFATLVLPARYGGPFSPSIAATSAADPRFGDGRRYSGRNVALSSMQPRLPYAKPTNSRGQIDCCFWSKGFWSSTRDFFHPRSPFPFSGPAWLRLPSHGNFLRGGTTSLQAFDHLFGGLAQGGFQVSDRTITFSSLWAF